MQRKEIIEIIYIEVCQAVLASISTLQLTYIRLLV